jgi:hypothetical protein
MTRRCRACGGALDTVLNLGELFLSDFPLKGRQPQEKVPLDFCSCSACGLVQLRHTVPADRLFRQYWYLSGINEVMVDELTDVVRQALTYIDRWGAGDLVVDIGANDGTLLRAYRTLGVHDVLRVGWEPALNLQETLRAHCEVPIPDYFPRAIYDGMSKRVKILTSIACFYASDDPRQFVWGVDRLLHPDGVWIVQFQDLAGMLQMTAFDNITPEHLFYPSMAAVERLLSDADLHVVRAESRAINGGSYRLYIQRRDKPVNPSVRILRSREGGCEDWHMLQQFAWRVGVLSEQILGVLHHLAAQGRIVDVYGASTKFNTTAQVLQIGPEQIRVAIERSPEKYGRTTVTGIPIVSEEDARGDPADVWLLGIWQFKDHVIEREAPFLASGRSIIVPMPHCEIIMEHVHGT